MGKQEIIRWSLRQLEGRKNLVGCEIGACEGWNALNILENFDVKKLYLIECFDTIEDAEERKRRPWLHQKPEYGDICRRRAHDALRGWEHKIVWIEKWSYDPEAVIVIPDRSLDFLYIDGDHSYKGVLTDLELYYPKVKKGGLIGGHDWYGPGLNGVKKAVVEYCDIIGVKELNYKDRAWCLRHKQNDWWFIKEK